MITYMIMGIIVLFLLCELAVGAKFEQNSSHFFDKENSNAMRGFWCLIVILVHIPSAFQNLIQDVLGSFAYIGVTFFFMTSAYGLRLSIAYHPDSIKTFWRRRLPKLIIPSLIVNFVGVLYMLAEGQEIHLIDFVRINGWVQWLLTCYLFFWICYKFNLGDRYKDIATCALVVMFSVAIYSLRAHEYITRATWCPEVYGFVWGITLFNIKDKIIKYFKQSWMIKCALVCALACLLGLTYLIFKPVLFFGDYILKIILGLAIILFILLLNTQIRIGNKVSIFLGEISFEIYLLHNWVFLMVGRAIKASDSGIFILISIIATILISAIVQRLSNALLKLIEYKKRGKQNAELQCKT